MAYGSNKQGNNRGLAALDESVSVFGLPGRFLKGAVTSVDDILRGLGRAGGAILSDVIAEPIRGVLPGGDPGFWRNEDGSGLRFSSYDDLAVPIAQSFGNTADTIGDLAYLPNLLTKGFDSANTEAGERLTQLNEDPFNFLLEHVGNLSLAGAAVAKPAQLGIAASRGAIPQGAVAQGLRPFAGRNVRATARQATQAAAAESSGLARATMVTNDIIGHPYRAAAGRIGGSRAAQLLRNPDSFDPVTGVGETLDNLGETNVKLFRGMAEEIDPTRVPAEGLRFTDDMEYALSNTNVAERHPFLYEVEVPADRLTVGTSEFADLLGENAGPRGAFLTPDELANARLAEQQKLKPEGEFRKITDPEGEDLFSEGYYASPLEDSPLMSSGLYGEISRSRGDGASRRLELLNQEDVPVGRATFDITDRGIEIYEVSIRPEYQGQGHSRAVLEEFEALSDSLGVDIVATPVVNASFGDYLGQRGWTREEGLRHSAFTREELVRDPDLDTPEYSVGYVRRSRSETPRLSAYQQLVDSKTKNVAADASTDPVQALNTIERVSQGIGYTLQDIKKSQGFQAIFGEDARKSRKIRDEFREGLLTGTGRIAERVRDQFLDKDTPVGNVNVRRKWDPSRVERLFLRDLKNLGKRPDAERWVGLVGDIDVDRITPGTAAKRVAEVASGARVVGQTLTPDGLLSRIDRVLNEAKTQSGGAPLDVILKEMLPGVDPMGLYLLGLNAVEKSKGLPENSLTAALGDYVSMDRFADLNRQAQQALQGAEDAVPSTIDARFRIPEEELGVDLNALPEEARNLFYGAAEQYRRDLAAGREPMLAGEGLIPEAGSRLGLDPNEPTRFPTELEDLPLSKEWNEKLRVAGRNKEQQQAVVEDLQARLEELRESGRPVMRRNVDEGVKYRIDPETGQRVPTKASMDRTFKKTQTGKAIDRVVKRLGKEKERLLQLSSRLEELELQAVADPANAPVSARNLLTYATRVAPEQAKRLRAMADQGLGDPAAYRALADELDAVPKTLEDLNSAEVYLAYLKDMKERTPAGEVGPGISSRRKIDTRQPGGTRRRGTETDIDYSRDFRARAYWQDAEFQSWFMARQADDLVRSQGLAVSGRERLKSAGYTDEQIRELSPGQRQQALERMGLKVYQPDQLFGTARKPTTPGVGPLDAQWITPFAEQNLMGAIESPGALERVVAEGVYDPIIRGWKVFALPLRLGWQVNNMAGNALLTTLVGQVNPFDYPSLLRASYRAVHDWNRGITSEIRIPLTDTYRNHIVSVMQTADDTLKAKLQNMLDEDSIVLTNEVLNDISSSGLTRGDFAWLNNSQFLRDIGANADRNIFEQFDVELPKIPGRVGERARNLKQTGREGVDLAYHLNEMTDNLHRTIIYLDQMGKGMSHTEAMSQVVKTLGDYNKLNGFERRVIKRIYPFYPWMRHITEVVARSLTPDNLTRTLIFTHLTNIFGQPNEWEEMLPEWAAGHMFMGMDENNKPKFLSTRGLNPFLDVFDPMAQPNMRGLLRPMNPVAQYAYEQVSGVSVLTGSPFSSPGQVFGSKELQRPPTSEYLFRNVPQLGTARDVYRDLMGQPLTRYGTGEPAFFEGAEEGRSSLQDIQQLFGYNVRPLDVESMREREIVNEFRKAEAQAKYNEQRESQGGKTASDLLSVLPGIG